MKRVDINLLDTYGAAIPMRGGVPFPKGSLKPDERVGLAAGGKTIPCDCEPIAWWDDGSVRCLRLDFVAPPGDQRLILSFGKDAVTTPAATLEVSEVPNAYRVNTGSLAFGLSKGSFGILSNCRLSHGRSDMLALRADGIDLVTRGFFRRAHAASADDAFSCALEESGANHAVFLLKGAFQDKRGKLFDYRLRLYCHGGSAAVRLTITLTSRQDEDLPIARAVELIVPAAAPLRAFATGIEPEHSHQDELPERGVEFFQTGPTRMTPDDRFQYCEGRAMLGRRAEGWVTASGEQCGVTAAVRRFWQQHPKGFRVSRDGIAVLLWPESSEQLMVLPRGCEKTYEMMLDFHGTQQSEVAGAAAMARAFTRPAVFACSPAWYCRSGAMGELTPAGTRGFDEFARAAAGAFAALKRLRTERREYGSFDYGDFSDTGEVDGWINVEYDTGHCLLTQFVRTGKRDYLDWGVDAAAHQGDIDIAHYVPTDESLVGSQSIHGAGHLARESKWFYHRTDHVWAEGLVEAYWLTGDRRFLENATLVGDYLARTEPCPDDDGAERPYGWSLIGLMAVYRATRGQKYLDAARKVAQEVLRRAHPERGLWLRCFGVSNSSDATDSAQPKSRNITAAERMLGSCPFMSGILVEGMIAYNQAAADPRVDDFVVKAARTWVREAWIERDAGFYYHPGEPDRGRPTDFRELVGLVRAYELTGDRRLLDVAIANFNAGVRENLERVTDTSRWSAKRYAIFMRYAPWFVAAVRRVKVLPRNAPNAA